MSTKSPNNDDLSTNTAVLIAVGTMLFVTLFAAAPSSDRETPANAPPTSVRILWHGAQDKPPPSILVSKKPVDLPPIVLEHRIVVDEKSFALLLSATAGPECAGRFTPTTRPIWDTIQITLAYPDKPVRLCQLQRPLACRYLERIAQVGRDRNLAELLSPVAYLRRFLSCDEN